MTKYLPLDFEREIMSQFCFTFCYFVLLQWGGGAECSCSPCWSRTHYIGQAGIDLTEICLTLPPKYWDLNVCNSSTLPHSQLYLSSGGGEVGEKGTGRLGVWEGRVLCLKPGPSCSYMRQSSSSEPLPEAASPREQCLRHLTPRFFHHGHYQVP